MGGVRTDPASVPCLLVCNDPSVATSCFINFCFPSLVCLDLVSPLLPPEIHLPASSFPFPRNCPRAFDNPEPCRGLACAHSEYDIRQDIPNTTNASDKVTRISWNHQLTPSLSISRPLEIFYLGGASDVHNLYIFLLLSWGCST